MALLGPKGKKVLDSAKDVLTIRSLGVLIWPLFLFWAAQNQIHLLVWMENDVVLYPSDATTEASLPFTFRGDSATSATVLTVHIINDGKAVIGSPDELWWLRLRAANATGAAVVGEIRPSPPDIVVRHSDVPDPRTVMFEVGALQPKARIELTMLLVNVERGALPELELEVELEGLPRPQRVGWLSPESLLANRLLPWVILGIFTILAVIRGFEIQKTGALSQKKYVFVFLLGQLTLLTLVSFIVGVFATKGLAWLVHRVG